MSRFKIYFYRTRNGRCQACDYAHAMEVHHQAKAKRWFLALAEFGPVVTNAFLKKSDPVPPAEIERALAALSDWRARGGDREA